MTTQLIKFRISEVVSSETQEYQHYTPPAGSSFEILDFVAEANYTQNSEVRVVWDYEGQNEEYLWTIKGSGRMDARIFIDAEEVDGVKKLALICDNGELNQNTMSAYMAVEVSS